MNNDNQTENGLGDLEKTVTINTLMETPFDARDEQWRDTFLRVIDGANLKLAEQEVVLSDEGFPYLQLETVKLNENFKAFVINKKLVDILGQGFGIVINPQNKNADWVFSYGDIVNFELNDEFYTNESAFSKHQENVTISPDEKILIGQPSDNILPKYLRTQLRDFLQHAGIKNPKIMLLARNYEDDLNVSQDIVFNFTPTQFANEEAFHEIMKTIAWFLPRHYSFFCIDEMAIENGFQSI